MSQGNWINEMFDAIDNRDAEEFVSYLTDDGVRMTGAAWLVTASV